MKTHPQHSLLLRWLILNGLIVFLLTVSWHQGIIELLFRVDRSRVSWIIALFYVLATLHCARRIYLISTQMHLATATARIIKGLTPANLEPAIINATAILPTCYMTDYIKDLYMRNNGIAALSNAEVNTDLISVYQSRLKGQHEIGWFASDIMLKLGLLGTIIGFILMLSSIANITNFDVSNIQKILSDMSNGMGTALYTTLAGLVCSLLSALQYQMLDRHADEVIELIYHATEVYIMPKLIK